MPSVAAYRSDLNYCCYHKIYQTKLNKPLSLVAVTYQHFFILPALEVEADGPGPLGLHPY